MTVNSVPTFTATIYVGLKERANGEITPLEIVRAKVQEYVNSVGLCVSLTETYFHYTNGGEPGVIIGMINYPRFTTSSEVIRSQAICLGELLLKTCKQMRGSVVFPAETCMLSQEGIQ